MILLSGHSRTPERTVPLEALSLSLKERESTATMTPADMSGISLDSWLLDDTNPGAGIVWRVKSIQQAYATATPTVQLEHVINTLKDRVLFGEIKAADMGGGETCTAVQALRFILGKQSDWKLGTVGYDVSQPYSFDGDTLYEAIAKVCESLDDPWWSFDMNRYPFTLNINPKPAGNKCELRPGRNLSAVTKTIDKTGMYTRFYPIGADDLHVPGDYVSKNEDLYGVISKIETDQSRNTVAKLRKWANDRLKKHAVPTVEVQADGMELADATGESIDRLTLGRICRIPLEEFGDIIEERIVGLDYRDKLHAPESVRVTLSNKSDDAKNDIVHVLANEIREGAGPSGRGGGGRRAARQSAEDHAWIEDTSDHVALCAVGIIGTDAQGNPNWTRLSRLDVNENGIYGTVQSVQGDLVIAESRIEQTETSINQTVQAVGKDGKITAASICLAINNGSSEARINANRIYLLGQTVADQLSAYDVKVKTLSTERGSVSAYTLSGTNFIQGGVSCYVPNAISNLRISLNSSTNIYTLQRQRFNDEDWVDVGNFSRAVTSWIVRGGGGNVTVIARPQGNQKSVPVSISGSNSITSNGTYTYTVYCEDESGDDVSTGATKTVTVNVSGGSYISHSMTCTNIQQVQGSTYRYTFTIDGRYNFTKDSDYTFYRTSW